MSDSDLIAQFLAKKGATVIAPGAAYGVDAEADKAKRAAAREDRRADQIERDSENYMQRVREERGYYRS